MSQLVYKSDTQVVDPTSSAASKIRVLGVTDRGTAILVDLHSMYTSKIIRSAQSIPSEMITDDHLLTGTALQQYLSSHEVRGIQGPAGEVGEGGIQGIQGPKGDDRVMTLQEVIRILKNYGIQIDTTQKLIYIQDTTASALNINNARLQSVQAVHFYEGEPVVDQNVTENEGSGVGGNTGNGEAISPSGPNSGL